MSGRNRYAIHRIDLDLPVPELRTGEDTVGLVIELYRHDRPVGFLMQSAPPGATIQPDILMRWIETSRPEEFTEDPGPVLPEVPSPTVTIAICTKDRADLLARCLDGLDAMESSPLAVEILVIDNGSKDPAVGAVVQNRPHVRYVRENRVGLNFARNRALREARHNILAFIDDDAVVGPKWLNGLETAWRRDPGAGAFTGQVFPYEIETAAQVVVEQLGGFRKGFRPVVFGPADETDPLYPCSTAFGNGCNMAFRVDLMRELGGFDEALDMGAFLPGGGDLDALYRVVRHGRTLVYEPQMLVRHQHRRDMKGLRRQIRRSWGAGTMAFLTKIRDNDPEMRSKAKAFIVWWVRDLARKVTRRKIDPAWPWVLTVCEATGALEGLNGLYRRAQQRAEAIRRAAIADA